MVQFRPKSRELIAKVVYYGPPLGGKTTNLRSIYAGYPSDTRGELIIVPAGTDRTIFFDFLPVELGTLRGMRVRVQLYTVPGQVRYNATRQVVLRGVDGVVFVADSQRAMLANNKESWDNLKDNLLLQGVNLAELAHVVQYNKRDLKDIVSIEQLDEGLNEYNAPFYEAVASEGIGVEETLQGMVKLVVRSLRERFRLDGEQALTQPIHMGVHGTGQPPAGGAAAPDVTTGFALLHPADTMKIEPQAPARPFAEAASPTPAPRFDAEITQVNARPATRDELSGFGGGLAAQWAALEARAEQPAAESGEVAWPLEGPAATAPAPPGGQERSAGGPADATAPTAPPDSPLAGEAFEVGSAPAPPAGSAAPALDGGVFAADEPAAPPFVAADDVEAAHAALGEAVAPAAPVFPERLEPGEAFEGAPPPHPEGRVPEAFALDTSYAAATNTTPVGVAEATPLFGPAAAVDVLAHAGGDAPQPVGDELETLEASAGDGGVEGPTPEAGEPDWSAPVTPAPTASPEVWALEDDVPEATSEAAAPFVAVEAPDEAAPAEPFAARTGGHAVEPSKGLEPAAAWPFAPSVGAFFPRPAAPDAFATVPALGLEEAAGDAALPSASSEDPFDVPAAPPAVASSDVFAIVPAPSAQVAAPAVEYEPETVVVPVEISAVRRMASRALAQVGEVRELELEVPVPAVWIGGRRMTLQVRLTLVPQEQDDEH